MAVNTGITLSTKFKDTIEVQHRFTVHILPLPNMFDIIEQDRTEMLFVKTCKITINLQWKHILIKHKL